MTKKNKKNFNYQRGQANILMIGILATILILALLGLGAIYLTTKNIINPPEASKKIKSLFNQSQEEEQGQDQKSNDTMSDQSRVIDPEKDGDGDGVPDEAEIAMGTDPYKAESLPQFVNNKTEINPEKDSDGDGVPDEAEIAMGTDPNKAEAETQTESKNNTTTDKASADQGVIDPEKDSDGDGVPDEAEIAMGTDPFKK